MTSETAADDVRGRTGWQRARRRLVTGAGPLLQQTVVATVAWVVAKGLFGHDAPFFAPVAAVVALNTSFGERGSNALRLLQGVLVGIVIGELTLITVNSGYGQLAIALFVAMAIARATGGTRVTVAQAAVGAILTVALGAESGTDRLADALIGAAVALGFTQFLFSPEPLRLLRRAESDVLAEMAAGLRLAEQTLSDSDERLAGQALDSLGKVRGQLTELARVRQASIRVARHSVMWRRRAALVVRETENAAHLDLLAGSCLMLTRVAVETRARDVAWLAPHVRELNTALSELSRAPDDPATRQEAASRTLRLARQLAHDLSVRGSPAAESAEEAAVMLIRIVAADIMTFAGGDRGTGDRGLSLA